MVLTDGIGSGPNCRPGVGRVREAAAALPARVRTWGVVILIGVGSIGPAPPATGAAGQPPSDVVAAAPVVAVENHVVTVDIIDAELADVLSQLAQQAGFQLAITGQLGRVTAAFTRASVEEALRQLVHDHELMLIYRAPDGEHGPLQLVQVDVFAGTPSRRGPVALTATQRTTMLAEVSQLVAAADRPYAIQRLTELVGSADPTVRARAAWALGRVGGPQAAVALAAATRDQARDVRVQAVYALRSAQAAGAVPTLGNLLLNDPDARVRRAAARVLGSLPGSEATSALTAATHDDDVMVRREVAGALRRRGVPATP